MSGENPRMDTTHYCEWCGVIEGSICRPSCPTRIADNKLGIQTQVVSHAGRPSEMEQREQRVVDPVTGGAKGSKLARFDLLPWRVLYELAEHFGRGARKYEDRNWERGYNWSLSFAALHRHLEAFWGREDIDDDPSLYVEGEPHVVRHIIAVVWHACVLAYFSRCGVGTDDRPTNAEHLHDAIWTQGPSRLYPEKDAPDE